MTPSSNAERPITEVPSIDVVPAAQALAERLQGIHWESILATLSSIWNVYSVVAIFLSLIFFAGFVYAKIRYTQLEEIYDHKLLAAEAEWARVYGGVKTKSGRWDEIQLHTVSDNPNDWRLAIIEADILLEEALTNAGFVGMTIGDKLKTANSGSFVTLQDAWEAHKVRNEIAHAGTDFVLTRKLAQETILRYERVFREFDVI